MLCIPMNKMYSNCVQKSVTELFDSSLDIFLKICLGRDPLLLVERFQKIWDYV